MCGIGKRIESDVIKLSAALAKNLSSALGAQCKIAYYRPVMVDVDAGDLLLKQRFGVAGNLRMSPAKEFTIDIVRQALIQAGRDTGLIVKIEKITDL